MTTKRQLLAVLLALALSAGLAGAQAAAQAEKPVVRAILFWMDSCRHCHEVIEQVLPPLKAKYGEQFDILLAEMKSDDDWSRLENLAGAYGVSADRLGVPLLIVGEKALVGSAQIGRQLPSLIDEYLAKGGTALPPQLDWLSAVPYAVSTTTTLRYATSTSTSTSTPAGGVRALYFYSKTCPHCETVLKEVLTPLQTTYGDRFEVKMLELGVPANYELLARAEASLPVSGEKQAIPVLVIGDQVLAGETEIRQRLADLVSQGFGQGGLDWPAIPGLEAAQASTPAPVSLGPSLSAATVESSGCAIDRSDSCATAAPVWAAYFYQVGCQECSRAKLDIDYVRSKYPQLVIEEFNIYDQVALAQWLADRVGSEEFHTPAIVIGQDALVGEQITPQALQAVVAKYAATGAEKTWADFNAAAGQSDLLAGFRSLGPLTVVLAGLVDGLNPCAFATLIFFVSYLTLSGRKGREVLLVGGAFTLGIFLAYLGIGLGFYKILDLLGSTLMTLGRWVYALTAILCAVLAVVAFLDFLKARRGRIEDMNLNLPEFLRLRINAVIRKQRGARAYVAVAFASGFIISFLELACTGQIYLPTIVFVASIPEMRLQAVAYLVIYNLLFIAPLIVVFVLAYYGTTSKQLVGFLQRRAAAVKLGMSFVFAALAGWLLLSLV